MNKFLELIDKKKIIIIDAHDTIFKRDLSRSTKNIFEDPREKDKIVWQLRDGFTSFLDYYKGVRKLKIVISSDGDQSQLDKLCTQFGIRKQIDAIYGYKHIDKSNHLKQLDIILNDLSILPEHSLFIGDGKIDEYSARKYNVDFVKVPNTIEDLAFTFHQFLNLQHTSSKQSLELQNFIYLKKIYHNLTTPILIENAIKAGDGTIAHLGPLVVQSGKHDRHLTQGRYIVKEPSSENRIDWDSEIFRPFDAQNFHLLQLRLQAFLQDREIYVQDCYVGTEGLYQKPLRIITQTAWHSMFARNMFVQIPPEKRRNFFPEFTIVHAPFFRAIPDLDGTEGEEFVIVNLLKKIVLIGGTSYAGEIRRSVYMLMSYFYLQEDVLPVKCSSNQGTNGDVAFFWGESSTTKSSITLAKYRLFLGDAYHGWTDKEVFNLEWGCYVPVTNLKKENNSVFFDAVNKFATILENVHLGLEDRRVVFSEPLSSSNARACFPITNIDNVAKSGIGRRPSNIIIIMKDGLGVIPPLVRLTQEQAILFLLWGYSSDFIETFNESEFRSNARFVPFFKDIPFILSPSVYALYLWEKIKSSNTNCWMINKSHYGCLSDGSGWNTKSFATLSAQLILSDSIDENHLEKNDTWGFYGLRYSPWVEVSDEMLNPERVWKCKESYQKRESLLIKIFHEKINKFEKDLDPPILNALPLLKKES